MARKPRTEPTVVLETPPHDLELEMYVLGAILMEANCYDEVREHLKPEVFHKDEHTVIYEAIEGLKEKDAPVNILTVTIELRKQEKLEQAGGPFYVTELTNKVGSVSNLEYYTFILLEMHLRRELMKASLMVGRDAADQGKDIEEVFLHTEKLFAEIRSIQEKKRAVSVGEAMEDLHRDTIKASQSDGEEGVATGFSDYDKKIGHHMAGELIVLAARPGMGKTSLALNMGYNAAKQGVPVAVFSLEMSTRQLVARILSSELKKPGRDLLKGKVEEFFIGEIGRKVGMFKDVPLYIDDSAELTVMDIRAKARRMKALYKIEFIIIDYLQLIKGLTEKKGTSREQEIATISRNLKIMAKELDIPVLALSQLSRKVEERKKEDRAPILSDLRESGAIEQDADRVIFIFRPEYYGVNFMTIDGNKVSSKGVAEIIAAKHRSGSAGKIYLGFQDTYTQFTDFAWMYAAQYQEEANRSRKTIESRNPINKESEDLPF